MKKRSPSESVVLLSCQRCCTGTLVLGILWLQQAVAFNPLPLRGITTWNTSRKNERASLFEATLFDREKSSEFVPCYVFSPLVKGTEPKSATSQPSRKNSTIDIAATIASGLIITIGAIYLLAGSYSWVLPSPTETNQLLLTQSIETMYEHVVYATLPEDTTDVFAIIFGESVGGLAGAACTTFVTALMRPTKSDIERKALLIDALADSDYFMVRAIAKPLLEARGLPDMPARIAGTLLAIIPFEILKLVAKQQQQLLAEEDRIMDELLAERRKKNWSLFEDQHNSGVSKVQGLRIDVAEVFADVIKWLAYDVFRTHIAAIVQHVQFLCVTGMSIGLVSAVSGALAGLAYQLYVDTIRTVTDYGTEEKLFEARNRDSLGWIALYGTECLAASVLFGVYESCREPVSVFIADAISGGMDSCLGSGNMKLCINTYIYGNPPSPDFGKQALTLVTAFATLCDRVCIDGAYDSQNFLHEIVLQVSTLVDHMMTLPVDF